MKYLHAVPLSLTFARILLGPAFIIVHRQHGADAVEWLTLIVAVALVTDWLDGATARWWGAVSTMGKLLDPLADAFFCMIVFVELALTGFIWPWVAVTLVAREALVTIVLRPYALRRGMVIAAGMMGKIKTSLQFIAILLILVMFMPAIGDLKPAVFLKTALLLAVVFFSVASATQYAFAVVAAAMRARNRKAPDGSARPGRSVNSHS